MVSIGIKEGHRLILKVARTMLWVAGGLALIAALLQGVVSGIHVGAYGATMAVPGALWLAIDLVFCLLVFGVGQLVGFLTSDRQGPGLLLRHGDKLLYLSAALGLLFLAYYEVFNQHLMYLSKQEAIWALHRGCVMLVWAGIKVGLGLVLRRVVPIVSESKNLV